LKTKRIYAFSKSPVSTGDWAFFVLDHDFLKKWICFTETLGLSYWQCVFQWLRLQNPQQSQFVNGTLRNVIELDKWGE